MDRKQTEKKKLETDQRTGTGRQVANDWKQTDGSEKD
jgi:hypothetical protein